MSRPLVLLALLLVNLCDRSVVAVDNLAELPHLMDVAHAAGDQRVCGAFRVGECLDGERLTILHR